ncbi:transposase [Chloroflexota bacterium]
MIRSIATSQPWRIHPRPQAGASSALLRETYQRGIRERYTIERKFGEAKQGHGLGRCRYLGIDGYRMQAYMTTIALNLKRMVRLLTNTSFRGRATACAWSQGALCQKASTGPQTNLQSDRLHQKNQVRTPAQSANSARKTRQSGRVRLRFSLSLLFSTPSVFPHGNLYRRVFVDSWETVTEGATGPFFVRDSQRGLSGSSTSGAGLGRTPG